MNASHEEAGEDVFEGQGIVEYSLILLFMALALFAVLSYLGNGLSSLFSDVSASFNAFIG